MRASLFKKRLCPISHSHISPSMQKKKINKMPILAMNSSSFHQSKAGRFNRLAYMTNRWYAVALSKDVKPYPENQFNKPYGTRILGRDVIVFRDANGVPQCMDGICPHRSAPLSQGKVVNNNAVCPYHGWEFKGCSGKLCMIPSCPSYVGALDQNVGLPKYHVVEKGGFIWLSFQPHGEKQREKEKEKQVKEKELPPIPFVDQLEDPNWKPVYGEFYFDAPHWSVFDNAIDMTHIHYLHGDSFGNEKQPVIHFEEKVDENDHMCTTYFSINNKPVSPLWEWTKTDKVNVKASVFLPSTSAIQIHLGQGVSMITFVSTVPIDAYKSVNRYALIRNFSPWGGFDPWAQNAMRKIFSEDKAMVEKLRPEKVSSREISVPSVDKPQLWLRKKKMQSWINDGDSFVDPDFTDTMYGCL